MNAEFSRWSKRVHRIMERLFARADARRVAQRTGKKLFIDAGANLGQGFTWFSRWFNGPDIFFELLEPNPNCHEDLVKLVERSDQRARVLPVALGNQQGTLNFYGLSRHEGGATSQGGSIVKEHNSALYDADEDSAIQVQVIDACKYIRSRADAFDVIIVKMDIEGAELDVLESMLEDGCIRKIDTLYVEFHARYRRGRDKEVAFARERALMARLRSEPIKLRIWH